MEQSGVVQLEGDSISCLICMDLLKDPVTVPCGHSYCMDCIKAHWDDEDQRETHSCPHCKQTFPARPVLVKNTTLEELVEELKKTGLSSVSGDHCYAGPEDEPCDVCSGRKMKAVKSCLVCRASYCEEHLKLHYESPAFEKHKLVDTKKPQENVCSLHDEEMKIFCRTDQRCICYLCVMDEHEGHETVSTAAERAEKQKKLQETREQILEKIEDRTKDVKILQLEAGNISGGADKAVQETELILTELIHHLKKARSEVKQQIRSQQEAEVNRVLDLQEKLEQEIRDLQSKDREMEQLSHTEDHSQFLHRYPSLSALSESTHSSSFHLRPLRYFEEATAAVVDTRDKLQELLRDKQAEISLTVAEVDVLLSEPEPKSRAGFLRHSCELTMDPNTAHPHLLLSEDDRKATYMKEEQPHPSHPDRFTAWHQVLSRESLTGRCYWEVESRRGGVRVAVTYRNIRRAGRLNECLLGCNDKSWALCCEPNSYTFWHNNVKTAVSGPQPFRVGVYLDHGAGVLAFYSVSETMTLLHRVQTTFTQPLHAGLLFYSDGDAAEFIKPEKDL
ncbi:tripartite motif-containing protein 16 [Oryzias latipes]|uniref:Tripartite motif-containing protein 16-like n=1 Tax=Oryzias latipes TaxID=8090 RepID=H2LC65_ORYLA|nr:tripartite motif-containing protein 16 [Oryzias latipes]